MPRDKVRYRDRRSSSHSSDSSHDRRKKSKYKRRSRSGDRSVYSESSSHRRRRSSSRSRHRRSTSRDRYEKSRRRSTSRTRSKRGRSHSRSSSRGRSKYRSKKSHRRSKSSSSRSSSFDIEKTKPSKKVNLDDTEIKLEKAIKAAEAAGLTMTKIPTYEYKEVEIREDMPTIHDRNLLAELNSDVFIQKNFTSSRNKKESKNIVIDLNAQTVKIPEADMKQKDDSIIDLSEIPNEQELKEMWIKKLYQYRKRMLKGEI